MSGKPAFSRNLQIFHLPYITIILLENWFTFTGEQLTGFLFLAFSTLSLYFPFRCCIPIFSAQSFDFSKIIAYDAVRLKANSLKAVEFISLHAAALGI